jgi:hypothetical protein
MHDVLNIRSWSSLPVVVVVDGLLVDAGQALGLQIDWHQKEEVGEHSLHPLGVLACKLSLANLHKNEILVIDEY